MYLLDYSLDNLSLMALTIATGFVVDDAIVVVEAVEHPIEEGRSPRDATLLVTFTELVDLTGAWFDISCAVTGQHNSATTAVDGQDPYITPNVNFVAGEQCTVTLFKDQAMSSNFNLFVCTYRQKRR